MNMGNRVTLAQRNRHIGRLTRDQVLPLLEAVVQQRESLGECPDCHWTRGNNWHHCAVYDTLAHAGPALQVHRDLRVHEAQCSACFVESQWREFEAYCARCEELSDLFQRYHRRLRQIEHTEQVRRFREVHDGRAPAGALELLDWIEGEEEETTCS